MSPYYDRAQKTRIGSPQAKTQTVRIARPAACSRPRITRRDQRCQVNIAAISTATKVEASTAKLGDITAMNGTRGHVNTSNATHTARAPKRMTHPIANHAPPFGGLTGKYVSRAPHSGHRSPATPRRS